MFLLSLCRIKTVSTSKPSSRVMRVFTVFLSLEVKLSADISMGNSLSSFSLKANGNPMASCQLLIKS